MKKYCQEEGDIGTERDQLTMREIQNTGALKRKH